MRERLKIACLVLFCSVARAVLECPRVYETSTEEELRELVSHAGKSSSKKGKHTDAIPSDTCIVVTQSLALDLAAQGPLYVSRDTAIVGGHYARMNNHPLI